MLEIETNGVALSEPTQVVMEQAVEELANFERQIKDIKAQEDELRKNLTEAMEHHGIIKLETPEVTVSYVAPSDSEYFDKARFRKENPSLYDDYVTMKEKKGYVRIKVK